MIYIYTLIDPTTERPRYVGLTRHLKHRLRQHRHCRSTNLRLNRWITKLKNQNLSPKMVIIHTAQSPDEADRMERYFIQLYREWLPDMMNLSDGGECAFGVSEETRKKLSAARKAAKGKYVMTQEHKDKIAAALKGRPNPNPKGFVKLNKARIGIPLSAEHKAKVSEGLYRRWERHRATIAES